MSITRFVTADGLPAFLAHLSKSARVLAPVQGAQQQARTTNKALPKAATASVQNKQGGAKP